MEKTRTSYKTAVVIIPPQSVWEQIQDIRRVCDKSYNRWMPHINLLYPFIEDAGDALTKAKVKMATILAHAGVQPFKVTFSRDSFGDFEHGARSTIWLKPLRPPSPSGPGPSGETTSTHKPSPPHRTAVPEYAPLPRVSLRPHPGKGQAPASGLDALAAAVWVPEDNASLRAAPPATGLDALADAVWGQGDGTVRGHTVTIATPKRAEPVAELNLWTVDSDTVWDIDTEEDSDTEDDDEEEEEEKGAGNPLEAHPSVMRVQAALQQAFPTFTDLSTRGEGGYAPHLTLGQKPTYAVEEFIRKKLQGWREISFQVPTVYIITRTNDRDPFSIKHTIPLVTL